MAIIDTVQRSRPVQLGIVCFFLIVWYFLRGTSEGFTPEELNSLLQNKDESTVMIKKTELTTHGLKVPYIDQSTFKPKNWYLAGNTLIKNDAYIRLTSDNQHQVGSMFSNLPIQAESFEMELTFHVHSKSSNLFGDGFGMWIIDRKSDIGDVFGAQNYFKGLGIFVDTYKNGKRGHFPYVNLMLGDGNTPYNKDTDGYETRLAGCTATGLMNPANELTKARIVYIKDGYFSLDFNYNNKHEDWKNCVTLTDIKLPQIKYLGFTAETGDLSENVDIIENKMYALYKPDGSFIESVDELETLMQEQSDNEELFQQAVDEIKEGGKHRKIKKKSKIRRKSLSRLKNSEKKIKERERKLRLEKYGDEDATLFKRLLKGVLYSLKLIFYILLLGCLIWIGNIVYRVQVQKKKLKVTGLLD